MYLESPQFNYLESCTVRLSRCNLRKKVILQFKPGAKYKQDLRDKGMDYMKPYLG